MGRVTSSVYPNPKSWNEAAFLHPHEPIRRDLDRMNYVLQEKFFPGPPEQQWKVHHFYNWYNDFFYPTIHHHHHIEDELVFPILEQRMKLAPSLTADHDQLLKLLDEIKFSEDMFNNALKFPPKDIQAKRLAAASHLRELVRQLRDHMLPHLADEERICDDLAKHFTEAEYNEIVKKIVMSLGFGGNKKVFPWIWESLCVWGTPANIAEFKATVPPPVLWLNNAFWIKDYKKLRLYLDSIEMDNDPIKPSRSCFCF
mmetsp:Transcript_15431/g.26502  ORF Transcript_15431/g.26502 Transcript_15431/m.26502 type:complete len:256 (-) Transcript_15431:371-1138(-)